MAGMWPTPLMRVIYPGFSAKVWKPPETHRSVGFCVGRHAAEVVVVAKQYVITLSTTGMYSNFKRNEITEEPQRRYASFGKQEL
jgi:hypothetical protein